MQVTYDFSGASSSYETKLDAKGTLLSTIREAVGNGYYLTSRTAAK
jgi:hypothetical protein